MRRVLSARVDEPVGSVLETWFTLAGLGAAPRPPPKWKLALVTGLATLAGSRSPATADDVHRSLGAEVRERYEYVDHPDWGRAPADPSGYLLQRFMVHADVHVGTRLRTFVQLASSLVHGRRGGARPTDEDVLDLHQAFAQLELGPVELRLGRQELRYGSSRLISVRDGPNVRRSFDGARASARLGRTQVDGLAVATVETDPGVFDDATDLATTLWGIYAAMPAGIDLYYLGVARREASYDQGEARERRHSIGARVWDEAGRLDYDVELVYQAGTFGGGAIRAWTVAADGGATVGPIRLGLKANATSGDDDPGDVELQTFHPLFPRGSYFGEASLIGPMNHLDVHPSVEWTHGDVRLVADVDVFWRTSVRDALYRAAGTVQVDGDRTRARFVGAQVGVAGEWTLDRHLAFEAALSRFFAGRFLRESGAGRDVQFAAVWLTYRR